MKILKIEMENYKKVRVFECELNGDNMIVVGKPDEGKTTAISALWDVIESKQDALRHGAKSGFIRITLGDPDKPYQVIAERKITKKTNSIIIRDAEGKKLDRKSFTDLVYSISADPLKVVDLKGAKLTEFLLACVKMPDGYDIESLDKISLELEQKRLDAFRAIKICERKLGEKPEHAEKVDALKVHEDIVTINTLRDHRDKIKHEQQRSHEIVERLNARIDELKNEIIQCESEINVHSEKIAELDMSNENIEAKLQDAGNDLYDEMKRKYENAIAINEKAMVYAQWLEREHELNCAINEHKKIDDKIKKVNKDKKTAMENARYPVDGLVIDDGKVYFEGSLLENCGTEKQIYVSTALVASQINGIKAMRVDRAESMGKEGREALLKVCSDLGIQVCMSIVKDSEPEQNEIKIVQGVYEG